VVCSSVFDIHIKTGLCDISVLPSTHSFTADISDPHQPKIKLKRTGGLKNKLFSSRTCITDCCKEHITDCCKFIAKK